MTTKKGLRCTRAQLKGSELCKLHSKNPSTVKQTDIKHKCAGLSKTGIECLIETSNGKPIGSENYYCYRHIDRYLEYENKNKKT